MCGSYLTILHAFLSQARANTGGDQMRSLRRRSRSRVDEATGQRSNPSRGSQLMLIPAGSLVEAHARQEDPHSARPVGGRQNPMEEPVYKQDQVSTTDLCHS